MTHASCLYLWIAAFAAILSCPVLSAGPIWAEAGDAGQTLGTAQTPLGSGTLTMITGTIHSTGDVDLYRIWLPGGGTFSAQTVGSALGDPQLFLFTEDGHGVYANDDGGPGLQAELPAGHILTPTEAGFYFLAVSSYNTDPYSATGLIFPSAPFSEVFGPTGPGGADPLLTWSGFGGVGSYEITLTGTAYGTPEPGTAGLALFALGGLLAGRYLRRRGLRRG